MDGLEELEMKFRIPKKVLIIGDVMLDIHTQGVIDRVSPEAPVLVLNVTEETYKPGGAGNVAVNIANLAPSSEICLFGFTGNDSNGQQLKNILTENGIQCYFDPNSKTTIKQRFLGKSSGQFQHLLRADKEETSRKRFTNKTKQTLVQIAEKADRIIVSDYAKGAVTSDLMELLDSYKKKIIIDPKPKNKDFKTLYKGVYLITPNLRESKEMSGYSDIREVGRALRRMFDSNILITYGSEGAFLFQNSIEPIKIPTIPQEEFDSSGAGDTHLAATVLAGLSGYTLEQAAEIGNYAAGITIRHTGVYAPNLDELISAISHHENETPNS